MNDLFFYCWFIEVYPLSVTEYEVQFPLCYPITITNPQSPLVHSSMMDMYMHNNISFK